MPLTLRLWPAFALHNRFVLAGRGGVQFGHGLDRSRYEDGTTDDVTLLDGEHWRQRLAEFEAAGSRGAVAHMVPTERDRRRAAMRGGGVVDEHPETVSGRVQAAAAGDMGPFAV